MSSNIQFVTYICDQLVNIGEITYKKMFGEFGLYINGKIFALVCDDTLFVKITESGKALFPQLETAPPYENAKPYFLIEDTDDRAALEALISATYNELPEPKKKRHR